MVECGSGGEGTIDGEQQRENLADSTQQVTTPEIAEELVRCLFDNARAGLFRLDSDSRRIIACNPRFAELLGYHSTEELLAETDHTQFYASPAAREALFDQLLTAGELLDYDVRVQPRQGPQLWLRLSAKLHPQEPWVDCSVIDVTRERDATSALAAQEERLRLVIDSIRDGFWDINVSTGEYYSSPKLATMLGYEPAELPQRLHAWAPLIHPDDRETAASEMRACFSRQTGEFSTKYRLKTKSGDWKWVLDSGKAVEWDADGKPLRIVGTHTDISEQVVSEAHERKRATDFQILIDNMPGLVYRCAVAAPWQMWFMSEATRTVTGREPAEFITYGLAYAEIVLPEDLPHLDEVVHNAIVAHVPYELDYRIRHADSSIRWVRERGQASYDDQGNASCLNGVIFDITGLKLAEQKLIDSEQRYRLLFEAESDAILLIDIESRNNLDANDAAVELYGYTRAELLALQATDLSAEPLQTQQRIQQADGYEHVELRWHRKKDGTVFPVEITGRALEVGGQRALLVAIRDISSRFRAEEALRTREEQYRTTVDALADPLHVVDSDLRIVLANAALLQWCEALGLRTDLMQQRLPQLFEFHKPELLDEYRQVFATGQPLYTEESTLIDGQMFITETRKIPSWENGQVSQVITILRDITERMRGETELQQRERKLQSIFRAAPTGIGVVENRVIVEANDLLCDMTGYTREELLGQNARLLYPDDEEYEFVGQEKYRQIAESGTGTVETVWLKKSGELIHVLLSSTPICAEDLSQGVTFTALDITQRHQAEVELRAAYDMLAEVNQQLEEEISERLQALAALQTSEERYRTVFEQSQLGIATGSLGNVQILSANAAYCSMLGYTEDELKQLSIAAITHPDDISREREAASEVLTGQRAEYTLEKRHLRKTGEALCTQVTASLVRDSLGQPLYWLAIVQDISARMQAERQRQASDDRFRQVVQNAYDIIALLDIDGHITYASPSLQRVLGYEPDAVYGRIVFELIHPEDQGHANSDLRQVAAGMDTGIPSEFRIRHTDGSWVHLEAIGRFLPNPHGRNELLITARDVTGKRTAEKIQREAKQALLEKTEELDRFFSLALDLLCIADFAGTFRRLNPAWTHALGYGLQELEGQRFVNLVHPDDRAATESSLARLAGGSNVVDFINRYKCKDGSYRWIEWRSSPHAGRLIYAAARDITERMQEEEAHLQLETQLRQAHKMEAIGTLAGGIAHDFNNILFAIMANAELLQDEVPDGAAGRENVSQILAAASRARGLVQQILTFSRKTQPEPVPLNLATVIKEVTKFLRATVPSTIEVRPKLSKIHHCILADPTEIHQVVMNLCTNAAQAMDGRTGVLEIELSELELDAAAAAQHVGLTPGIHVCLKVSDTGHGMDRAVLERVFEPFFTTKSTGKGTGMGLAVVHGIIAKLGGVIEAASRPGQGTAFTAYLPATALEEHSALFEQVALAHGSGNLLLVDDEQDIVNVVSRMLYKLGYSVTSCTSSAEALELFAQDPLAFDAVVTDQTMPKLTGADMAQRMLELRPGLPVLLCTGFSSAVPPEAARAAGISENLYKPLTQHELASALARALGKPAISAPGNAPG